MKNILIKAQDVCKSFKQSKDKVQVLQSVTADVFEGDFTVVMGTSGAGKSTLLYALSGMDKITSGSVEYKEQEISSLSEKRMAELRAKEFGFVFQQTHLVSNLTLFENVAVAGYVSKKRSAKEVQEKAMQLLDRMHVEGARNRLPSQASGGEAQRAAIARAMINNPGLIFADEPTGALNRSNTEEVLNLLTALNESGQSLLMVTHELRAAIRGTRLLYLEDGKILDELTLPAYREEEAKKRESQVSAWLASMEW